MGTCFSCGREGVKLFDVGALAPELKACFRCYNRHNIRDLAAEGDRVLAQLAGAARPGPPDKASTCWHCGAPTIGRHDGSHPIICTGCLQELKELNA